MGVIGIGVSCTPEIGDKCIVSTDCSVQGDRLCDVSQPGGYCTQLNCRGNDCFNEAACVLFNSAVPGCGYNDRAGGYGSRVARSFCMAMCVSDTDCRSDYVCADPRSYPWGAVILDDIQTKRGCLPKPLQGQDAGPDSGALFSNESPVCQAAAPIVPAIDASAAKVVEAGSTSAPPLFAPTDAGDGGG